jgi:hypothetical protein
VADEPRKDLVGIEEESSWRGRFTSYILMACIVGIFIAQRRRDEVFDVGWGKFAGYFYRAAGFVFIYISRALCVSPKSMDKRCPRTMRGCPSICWG